MLKPWYLAKRIRISMLFVDNRVLKLVFGSRFSQAFMLIAVIMLVARFAFGSFGFFIMANRMFVSNYIWIVWMLYVLFDFYLQKFVLNSFLFFLFWMSWIWVPLIGIFIKTRKGHLEKMVLENGLLNGRVNVKDIVPGVFRVLSLVLILVLYSYRYFVYPVPQGWDTAYYLESLRGMNMDFFGSFSSLDRILRFPLRSRPLFFLVLYSVNLVVGCDEVTLMVLPIVFAVLYAFVTYEFVLVGTDNKYVASLAMVLAPLSYFTVRLSFDLYTNFFSLIFVLLFLTVFIKVMKNASRRNLLLGCILFSALVLVHVWTWMVFLVILVSFAFIQFVRGQKNFRKNLSAMVLIILPSIIIGLVMVSLKPTIIPFTGFSFFSFPYNWYGTAVSETPFLLIPAVYGLYLFFTKNSHFTNLIVAWVFVLSLLIFVTGFTDSYRFYILYPVGILAAFGVYDMIGKADSFLIKFNKFSLKKRVVLLYVFVPFVFCLLVFSSTLPEAFNGVYLQRPNSLAMTQIYCIYWACGYNNKNIIVLLYDPPAEPLELSLYSHIDGWARAYIGFDSLYFGNLTSLLEGYPDSFGRTFDTSNKIIILASELYRLTALELSMCKEVNCLGIYIVTSKNISSDCLEF